MGRGSIVYLGGFELPDKNAAAHRVISNAKLLREMGFDVILLGVTKGEGCGAFHFDGFLCRCIKYPRGVWQWLYHINHFIPVEEIKQYSPRYIVLYNFPAVASLNIIRYFKKDHVKVIHDLTEWEETPGWTLRKVIKRFDTTLRMHYCIRQMDGVIAISRYLYNYYCKKVPTILVPPTVDLEDSKWMRNRALVSNCPRTLIYAGNPGGGVKDRLDLIVDIIKKKPQFRLVIVGLNEDQFYESFRRPKEHYDNIVFRGRLPHEDTLRLVCMADFQMLIRDKTRKNDAGFPTKLAESMACGIPVITTVFSNVTDYVQEGTNGFIVNHGINDVLTRIQSLTSADIVEMKQKCIDDYRFDYKNYKKEFSILFK